MLRARSILRKRSLQEPIQTHVTELWRRAAAFWGTEGAIGDSDAWAAGLEYLALRVDDRSVRPEDIALAHSLPTVRVLRVLPDLRESSQFRAYIGEWIRLGRPLVTPAERAKVRDIVEVDKPVLEVVTPEFVEQLGAEEEDPADGTPREPLPAAPDGVLVAGAPGRWRAPFELHKWQREAGQAWRDADRRGIARVVTGAGKTAFALHELAVLMEDAQSEGSEIFVIVIVPRVALIDQWERDIRRMLNIGGLRIGKYYSGERCYPASQDILLITVDSARRLLPEICLARPTLLIADECHRLGAPAASQVFEQSYKWTLGLSATPERESDTAFEDILVPNLGDVVYEYGYEEAVRDGIIACFDIALVRLSFRPSEKARYEAESERVKKLLDGLKRTYRELRSAKGLRFFQIFGKLKQQFGDDDSRFDAFTAAASMRRSIVHLAEAKFDAVKDIAESVHASRRILCFHERIEAADRMHRIVEQAGKRSTVYHIRVPSETRAQNLRAFGKGRFQWLIACKALDEGLDIPEVDTVLIAAGTKSTRQVIQRLGRALRRKRGDRSAQVILLEIAGVGEDVLEKDGLEDLRRAASTISALDLDELVDWVRAGNEGMGVWGKVETLAKRLLPRKKRSGKAQMSYRSSSELREDSWTGTPGSISYYDKDSSPE